jgi:hypothetical protein
MRVSLLYLITSFFGGSSGAWAGDAHGVVVSHNQRDYAFFRREEAHRSRAAKRSNTIGQSAAEKAKDDDHDVEAPQSRDQESREQRKKAEFTDVPVPVKTPLGIADSPEFYSTRSGIVFFNVLLLLWLTSSASPMTALAANSPDGKECEKDENKSATRSSLVTGGFVVLCAAHVFLSSSVATVASNSVVMMAILFTSHAMRLIISAMLYFCFEGTPTEFLQVVVLNGRGMLLYLLPAVCYVVNDFCALISFVLLSPAEYQVLIQLRIVLIAFAWQSAMRRNLSTRQWLLLFVCVWAVILKERNVVLNSMLLSTKGLGGFSRFLPMGIQLLMSTVGGVANEKLLKSGAKDLHAQNMILNLECSVLAGAIFCGMIAFGSPATDFHQAKDRTILSRETLAAVMPMMMLCISIASFTGIASSYLLKRHGNIEKELASMAVTIVVAAGEWLVLRKSPCGILDVESVALLVVALSIYIRLEGNSNSPKA